MRASPIYASAQGMGLHILLQHDTRGVVDMLPSQSKNDCTAKTGIVRLSGPNGSQMQGLSPMTSCSTDPRTSFISFPTWSAKVETLMCYMGIGDTFTPFHKDACASSGQNLMCYSENGGSSFWFMTKASDAPDVALYFLGLGQVVDLETHVVTLDELRAAPFDVYIAEQCVGDLVLVPPRSCHQVVNSGGITIKTSWSRMSLDGLQAAFYHELPIYHRLVLDLLELHPLS
ncbi:hypothetical protein ID866_3501 [Astraeus odoratus]|nr:hypothetical protein ID866_3501 [Astraeus odoratus]